MDSTSVYEADEMYSEDSIFQVMDMLNFVVRPKNPQRDQIDLLKNENSQLKLENRRLQMELDAKQCIVDEVQRKCFNVIEQLNILRIKNQDLENSANGKAIVFSEMQQKLEIQNGMILEKDDKVKQISECLAEFGLAIEILTKIGDVKSAFRSESKKCNADLRELVHRFLGSISFQSNDNRKQENPQDATEDNEIQVKLGISKEQLWNLRKMLLSNERDQMENDSEVEFEPICTESANPSLLLPSSSKQRELTRNEKQTFPESQQVLTSPTSPSSANIEVSNQQHRASKSKSSRGSYNCICGTKCSSQYVLKRHIVYYSDDKIFQCQMCNEGFPVLRRLNKHMKMIHEIDCTGMVGCIECGMVFQNRLEHSGHRKTVHGSAMAATTNNAVSLEGQKASSNKNHRIAVLRNPKKVMTHGFVKGNGLTCQCGRQFSKRGLCLAHIKYFTTEHKFSCKICSKKFFTSKDLRRHIWTHGIYDSERYGCTTCWKMFATFMKLMQHRQNDHPKRMVKRRSYLANGTWEQKKVKFLLPCPPEEVRKVCYKAESGIYVCTETNNELVDTFSISNQPFSM